MTLTHQLPSLRRSIPDPINFDSWPELTVATPTDVIVSGVSLIRLVEICGTPCVHTAAAVIAGTRGRPSPTDGATTVVVRVTAVEHVANSALRVSVDGRLRGARAVFAEARLIGRASTAHNRTVMMVDAGEPVGEGAQIPLPAGLPGDIHPGDLIVIPCPGLLALRQVSHRADGRTSDRVLAAMPARSTSWLASID